MRSSRELIDRLKEAEVLLGTPGAHAHNSGTISGSITQGEPPLDLPTPYHRGELEGLLPVKFWNLMKAYGEPNVDDDPDIQTIAASHCVYVIMYVLNNRGHELDAQKVVNLQNAQRRESDAAMLFLRLAAARMAVIQSIGNLPVTYEHNESGTALLASMPGLEPIPVLAELVPDPGLLEVKNGRGKK